METIFHYTDHLEYLQDRYNFLQEKQKFLSHRYISQKLGQKTSSIFCRILKGEINISKSCMDNFIDIFKLSKQEADYFRILVHLSQSEDIFEKIYNVNKLITFVHENKHAFDQKLRHSIILMILIGQYMTHQTRDYQIIMFLE